MQCLEEDTCTIICKKANKRKEKDLAQSQQKKANTKTYFVDEAWTLFAYMRVTTKSRQGFLFKNHCVLERYSLKVQRTHK